MIDKLSEGITSAFNTAGTEANKAKLQTEIAMKQHQIKGIKQEFGVRGQCMKSNRTSRRPHWPPSGRGAPGAARLGAVTAESWPHRSRRGTSWRATTPRASRRYSSKGRRPRRTSSATWASSSGSSPTGRAQADACRVRDRAGRSHAVPKSNFSVPHLHPTRLISTQAPKKASPSRRRPPTARRSGSRCPRGHLPARRCMYAYR